MSEEKHDLKEEENPADVSIKNEESKLSDVEEITEQAAIASMTHTEAMERFRDGLAEIIIGDPLLSDLPTAATVEEINSQIALEYGQAMTVNVRRGDNSNLSVVVVQNATVQDLKHAIQRAFMLKQKRENGTDHISWRYIWKSYWIYYNGEKLMQDNKTLRSYGIRNKDEVTFMKRLQQK